MEGIVARIRKEVEERKMAFKEKTAKTKRVAKTKKAATKTETKSINVVIEAKKPTVPLSPLGKLAAYLETPIEGLPVTLAYTSNPDVERPWSVANSLGTQLSAESLEALVEAIG